MEFGYARTLQRRNPHQRAVNSAIDFVACRIDVEIERLVDAVDVATAGAVHERRDLVVEDRHARIEIGRHHLPLEGAAENGLVRCRQRLFRLAALLEHEAFAGEAGPLDHRRRVAAARQLAREIADGLLDAALEF